MGKKVLGYFLLFWGIVSLLLDLAIWLPRREDLTLTLVDCGFSLFFIWGGWKLLHAKKLETAAEVGGIEQPHDIIPVPMITHKWEITTEDHYWKLTMTVENLGPAPIQDVYILAGFDAGADELWNTGKSTNIDLVPGNSTSVSVNLTTPSNKHTRLVVQIVGNGSVIDESYSEWFDTH